MKDFKEAILEATRNNARPYTKEQAAAYAEIFEHVIAAFAENNALSYEEAYNQIAPSFSDNTGTFDPENPNILFQSAYHGTPHRFNEFRLDSIGTGEGAQAHGWGLYFAKSREVSEGYRKILANSKEKYVLDGKSYIVDESNLYDVWREENGNEIGGYEPVSYALRTYSDNNKDVDAAIEEIKEAIEILKKDASYSIEVEEKALKLLEGGIQKKKPGQLFEVDIPENDVLLDEQKRFNEQPEKVRKAIEKLFLEHPEINVTDADGNDSLFFIRSMNKYTGARIYKLISNRLFYQGGGNSDMAASRLLNEYGVKGITYEGWQDGRCFVVFDDKAINILTTFYQSRNHLDNLTVAREMGSYRQFQIRPDEIGKGVITFFESADISTAGHEMGHWLRQVLEMGATMKGASASARQDWKTVCDHFGAPYAGSAWTRHQEEAFADTFLAYLRRGEAPSENLRKAFDRLKDWLTKLYSRLVHSESVTCSLQIKEIFDQLLVPKSHHFSHKEKFMAKEQDFYKEVAEKLIDQLQKGTAPWQRPWEAVQGGLPRNPTTGEEYHGGNVINLLMQGYQDPRWMTFRQAGEIGARVRKGEHGTRIIYWRFEGKQPVLDEDGKPKLDADGKQIKEEVRLERPRPFISYVFNAEQIEGLPPLEKETPVHSWSPVEKAEELLAKSGARIEHRSQSKAYYTPSTDTITLPLKEQFKDQEGYYSTALHELGHWTGHESRLARDIHHPFGSEAYAREELRAEIASMLLSMETGIPNLGMENHAAYVQSWIKVLREDPKEIFRASADAGKIFEYVMKLDREQEQQQGKEEKEKLSIVELEKKISEEKEFNIKLQKEIQDKNMNDIEITPQDKDELKNSTQRLYLYHQRRSVWELERNISAEKDSIKNIEKEIHDKSERNIEVTSYDRKILENAYERLYRYEENYNAEVKELEQLEDEYAKSAISQEKFSRRIPGMERQTEAPEAKATMPERQEQPVEKRVYLNVPYREKGQAKQLGAGWDRQRKQWYVPSGRSVEPFAAWLPQNRQSEISTSQAKPESHPSQAQSLSGSRDSSRIYLAVPYREHREAKKAGAEWDSIAVSWYVGPKADMEKLARWMPGRQPEQMPAPDPREEFAEAMRSMNFVVEGEHPVMDGKPHRIQTADDKPGQKSGFYIGYLDGRPAGYMQDNRTGEEMRWKCSGPLPSRENREKFQASCQARKQEHAAALQEQYRKAAERVQYQLGYMQAADSPLPYHTAKGIEVHAGGMAGREGTLCLPAHDVHGKIWTMQYINADGSKRFARESRKEGCFHPVGGMNAIRNAPAIVICEGYATACSVAETLGIATVAAFDSGNLASVARALHEKFPDKPIVIAGDDDRAIKVNTGRIHAEQAAKEVGGVSVFPVFAPAETGKDFTDFNDLAVKSCLGKDAVKRQVGPVVRQAIQTKQAELAQLRQQQQSQDMGRSR